MGEAQDGLIGLEVEWTIEVCGPHPDKRSTPLTVSCSASWPWVLLGSLFDQQMPAKNQPS